MATKTAKPKKPRKPKPPTSPPVADIPPPELIDPNLRHALTATPAAREVWDYLRREGASDERIEQDLGHIWGAGQGHTGDGVSYRVRGGVRPGFWLGNDENEPETLVGPQLVEQVRRVLELLPEGEKHDPPLLPLEAPVIEPAPVPEPSANGTLEPSVEESLQAIAAAERALEQAEEKCEDLKVDYREARAAKEKARKKLHEVIREETGLEPTLFNQQRRNGQTPAEKATSAAIEQTAESNATASDDEVKATPIKSLGLPKGIVEKLGGAGISTLGDYYDYVHVNEQGWGKRISDISGIGKGAVDKIEAAVLEYVEELARQRKAKIEQADDEVED